MKPMSVALCALLCAAFCFGFCCAVSWDFPGFANSPSLMLNGDTTVKDGVVILTPAKPATAGSVWFTEPVDPAGGFSTYWLFRPVQNLQNTSEMPARPRRCIVQQLLVLICWRFP